MSFNTKQRLSTSVLKLSQYSYAQTDTQVETVLVYRGRVITKDQLLGNYPVILYVSVGVW